MAYSEADQQRRDQAIAAYQADANNALALLQSARVHLPLDGGLLISEAGALIAQDDQAALDNLTAVLDQAPDWIDGHIALAQFRFEKADPDYLAQIEKALQLSGPKAALWRLYMQLLADGGQARRACDTALSLRKKGAPAKELMLLEARYAGLAGLHDRAGRLFAQLPGDWEIKNLDETRHQMRIQDFAKADKLLQVLRDQNSEQVTVWALTELCWRIMDDPRHSWLLPEPLMPVQINLHCDAALVQSLSQLLHKWHHSKSRPLSQSVRHGSQTRGNLFFRRNGEIAELKQSFMAAITDYIGSWPAEDPDHPLLHHRDQKMALTAGWSILIKPPGHHVSHVHDGGLISSAFHIGIPQQSETGNGGGALELGRAPIDLACDVEPLTHFQPKAGHLVLFPSFLYHGTRPIDRGERLTIAFDAGAVGAGAVGTDGA
ncbi:MAG: putative 2OG-Fe(II) oxygenase [Parasphingorhabdus sp.]|uniref:putative 2OG-Fe(II) oxygenase n=1 Tax=Parasphingorhabdus sp. TaxID=2709688 RepID=UPI003299C28F